MGSLIWLNKIAYMLKKKNQNNKQLKIWSHINKIEEKHNLIPERSIYKFGECIMPIWVDINTRFNNENNLRRYFDDYQVNYSKQKPESTLSNLWDNDVSTNFDAENEKQKHTEEIKYQYIVGSKSSNNIVKAIINYKSSTIANNNVHLKSNMCTGNVTEEYETLGIFQSNIVVNNDSKKECSDCVHDKSEKEIKIAHLESIVIDNKSMSSLQSCVGPNNHKKDTATDRSVVGVNYKTTLETETEHFQSNVDSDGNDFHDNQEIQPNVGTKNDTKQHLDAMNSVQPNIGQYDEDKQDTSNVNFPSSLGADNKNKDDPRNPATIKYQLLHRIPLMLLHVSLFIGRSVGNVFP
ncbi:uncharacterized protein LOC119678221 [Teleopsis dalmanni]|uniref:uncharacterized protein LOC119678221 n=1 Tax=Teleopsis dalmanni TaxID=139649 RepID=UPI0018CF1E5A|nr:uncharacterized protein LOC119678221 [Teleopsis dalmanni]XP_037945862.1 uncharacterized protein LOC119678221 [Teleopsis dalmanni]XP_037945863.1 uncharacterized protein LOC119678221 [Teleopsis dalmanni]XP_037945864.1 uncharacterized protein LOC119678221 [Teleopsis dalmanni]